MTAGATSFFRVPGKIPLPGPLLQGFRQVPYLEQSNRKRLCAFRHTGAMRFMMQYDPGHGDYSKERHEIFRSVTLEELLESINRANPEKPQP
jgi:hypothetical protein